MSSDDRMSTREAAERLGVSPQRVTQLIGAGQLDAEKVSGVWLVDRAGVEYRSKASIPFCHVTSHNPTQRACAR